MQIQALLPAFVVLAFANAAYVPSEPWSTLTPSATLSGGATDYTGTFGIAIEPIATTASSVASATASVVYKPVAKLVNKGQAVSQIGDGQIQGATTTTEAQVVTQIGDGQIQASTATEAQVVTQIGDGQIQAATTTSEAQVVTQIGDGQIQAATTTSEAQVVTQIGDGQIQAATTTSKAQVVSQIGDGQIQAATTTTSQTDVVSQIGDGQVQAPTTVVVTETQTGVTQIGDGQVQYTKVVTSTETGATQIGDGQVQASSAASSDAEPSAEPTSSGNEVVKITSCLKEGSLAMTLKDSILTDSKGRIGSIVANQQFQFDGPPPQAGAIYAAGWSISDEDFLAIGNSTTFYQCLSGDFYNLYDSHIGSNCTAVNLRIVDLVSC